MSTVTRVQFIVEITKSGRLSEEETIGVIKRIALREAEATLRNLVNKYPNELRIIGKPKNISFVQVEDL